LTVLLLVWPVASSDFVVLVETLSSELLEPLIPGVFMVDGAAGAVAAGALVVGAPATGAAVVGALAMGAVAAGLEAVGLETAALGAADWAKAGTASRATTAAPAKWRDRVEKREVEDMIFSVATRTWPQKEVAQGILAWEPLVRLSEDALREWPEAGYC